MTKILRIPLSCNNKQVSSDEVDRLFKQEKIRSWTVSGAYIYIEVPDNEDVSLE